MTRRIARVAIIEAMVRVVLLLCAACIVSAAPQDDLLQRVRVHMARTLTQLPNYTCLQTIQRTERRAPSRKFQLLDTVRLEVALVDGKELFAWPGEKKFQDREINEIVTGGAIGNGSFALHAKAVFSSGAPKFDFVGERIRDGRRTYRWDFEVPQNRSGYVIRAGPREAVVGYHGSFWVDSETLDLIRLELEADNIPPELKLLRAGDTMEYTRMKIGEKDFLLPGSSELHMIDETNSDSINRTQFSGCRQYTGESVLIFGDPAELEAKQKSIREIELPPNIELDTTLETPIHSADSAIGDPVTFKLQKQVRKDGEVLVPKGALLHGRITLLRRRSYEPAIYAIGITITGMESPGLRIHFDASLYNLGLTNTLWMMKGVSATQSNQAWRMERILSEFNETTFGSVFFLKMNEVRLPAGMHVFWRTRRTGGNEEAQ